MTTETKTTEPKYTVAARYHKGAVFPYYGPHRIGESFDAIGHEQYLVITSAQADSLTRVIANQGTVKSIGLEFGRDPALMVAFDHIVIGIEPDGYAHS